MKRLLVLLSSLALLLALAACGQPAVESPSPDPSPTPSEIVTTDPPVPTIALPEDVRYFFADGTFLGSWSGGHWRSAADGGFALGELFDRDYLDPWGEALGAVRFFVADGPGAFDDPEQAASLLEPYGVIEGDYFIMALPAQLTGDAAQIPVPTYGFYALFDGQAERIASNVALTIPTFFIEPAHDLSDQTASDLLSAAGIDFDPARAAKSFQALDLDGDGQDETLTLLQNPTDDTGYLTLEEGDPIFYALLLTDDGQTSLVCSRSIDYTDDVTAHFTASDLLAADLDGDGQCELIFREKQWEGGSQLAYSLVDGQWTQVLRANYGM